MNIVLKKKPLIRIFKYFLVRVAAYHDYTTRLDSHPALKRSKPRSNFLLDKSWTSSDNLVIKLFRISSMSHNYWRKRRKEILQTFILWRSKLLRTFMAVCWHCYPAVPMFNHLSSGNGPRPPLSTPSNPGDETWWEQTVGTGENEGLGK